jgi:hypothetical protein
MRRNGLVANHHPTVRAEPAQRNSILSDAQWLDDERGWTAQRETDRSLRLRIIEQCASGCPDALYMTTLHTGYAARRET